MDGRTGLDKTDNERTSEWMHERISEKERTDAAWRHNDSLNLI